MSELEQKWVDLTKLLIENLAVDMNNMQKEMDAKKSLRDLYITSLENFKPAS